LYSRGYVDVEDEYKHYADDDDDISVLFVAYRMYRSYVFTYFHASPIFTDRIPDDRRIYQGISIFDRDRFVFRAWKPLSLRFALAKVLTNIRLTVPH